ncbi:MAG: DNA (cytosine-5-)-methyltransferase [Clostridia bacterium]|nr:DNA (cytosine-5-)-methyltransferase [Clostridia bacterium]
MQYKVGSMFAGVGGICLGFKNAQYDHDGYSLVWANEIDEYACETYRTNFSHLLLEGDINKIIEPNLCKKEEKERYEHMHEQILSSDIDILTGGFPCQAFSIAGDRKGFEDERGNLFMSIIKLVNLMSKKPRVIFLENVRNLVAHDKGRTYRVIKSAIEELGYYVKEKVFNTMEMTDIPQNRERIYILCFKNKNDYDLFDFAKIEKFYKRHYNKQERENQIRNIIDYNIQPAQKYYYTEQKYPHYFIHNDANEDYVNLNEQITEMYQFYQLRRGLYVRKNKSDVCPTLTANMGTGGHNVPLIYDGFGIRKLLPYEAFRLQGFPLDYILPTKIKNKNYPDSMLYKQAGNAVSVPVIQILATELLKVFNKNM